MKTLYNVLGATKGDATAKTYGDSLVLLDVGISLDAINEITESVIKDQFKNELESYCNYAHKIDCFVIWEMVEELQTYHYL